MKPTDVSELLERAAASVTPTETDPAPRLLRLGRRSVQRRRRAWAVAGCAAAAAVVTIGVALPITTATPDTSSQTAGAPTVGLGGLSVAVPDGWRTSQVETFTPCTAEPRTVYLAAQFAMRGPAISRPAEPGQSVLPQEAPTRCASDGQAWMALVQQGVARHVQPPELAIRNGRLLEVDSPDQRMLPSLRTYRVFNDEIVATTAFISGDEKGRAQLLEHITWPAGPPAPATRGLPLPDRLTSATTDVPPSNGMVVATDAGTLTRIRTALAALREPVPAGDECTLGAANAVGIALGGPTDDSGVTVVVGDATCPQAISTGGGRVRVPAGLGTELLDLIVASDRAASGGAATD